MQRILARRLTRHVDVDGDGRPDIVTVSWTHVSEIYNGTGTATVTVRFASGRTAAAAWHVWTWRDARTRHSMPWGGAQNLDARPGKELIVGLDIGASNTFFRVLTYAGHTLRWLPAPPGTQGWEIGGSVGTGTQAFGCPAGEVVAVDSLPEHPDRMQTANGYVVTRSTYRWTTTGWVVLARSRHVGHMATHLPMPTCAGLAFP